MGKDLASNRKSVIAGNRNLFDGFITSPPEGVEGPFFDYIKGLGGLKFDSLTNGTAVSRLVSTLIKPEWVRTFPREKVINAIIYWNTIRSGESDENSSHTPVFGPNQIAAIGALLYSFHEVNNTQHVGDCEIDSIEFWKPIAQRGRERFAGHLLGEIILDPTAPKEKEKKARRGVILENGSSIFLPQIFKPNTRYSKENLLDLNMMFTRKEVEALEKINVDMLNGFVAGLKGARTDTVSISLGEKVSDADMIRAFEKFFIFYLNLVQIFNGKNTLGESPEFSRGVVEDTTRKFIAELDKISNSPKHSKFANLGGLFTLITEKFKSTVK